VAQPLAESLAGWGVDERRLTVIPNGIDAELFARAEPAPEGRRLCSLDDLKAGGARRYDVAEHRIALVRIGDDVYAIGDRCTHQNVSLAEGEVYERETEIECVKHGSSFSLVTGESQCLPATEPTPVYRVEVINGEVYVELDRP